MILVNAAKSTYCYTGIYFEDALTLFVGLASNFLFHFEIITQEF